MGYDASSYAVLGYKIEPNEYKKTTARRGCSCALSSEQQGFNFCPQCGKQAMAPIRENLLELMDNIPADARFGVAMQTCEGGSAYVGLVVRENNPLRSSALASLDMNALAKEIQAKLDIFGIDVDTGDFGLFAVKYESY
jgi:hypothetical protein